MAATDTPDVVAALTRHYMPEKLISLALKDAPLTAYFPKSEDGQGEIAVMRMLKHDAGGTGANVTDAIAAETGDGYVRAILDWKLLYTSWSVKNPAIKRSQGSKQVVDILQQGVKGTMNRHGQEIETLLFGAGNGKLGRRASISSNTVTLSNAQDAFNFQVGQVVVADDTEDGSSLRTGSTTVTGIDYTGGKVTLASAAGITGFADNDYLFLKGLVNAGAVPGLARILPITAPVGGDNFGGLDRSVAPEHLSGWRYTGTAGDLVTEQIIKGLQQFSKGGGHQDTVWVSVDKMTQLILEQGNRVEWSNMTSEKYKVNFKGVMLMGPKGPVHVQQSIKCPDTLFYATERDSWLLQSVQEPLVAVATKNGKYLDAETDDVIRLRWRSQFQLLCKLPGHNGVGQFTS